MNDNMVDALKASLARVLPGALVLLVGILMMLGVGIILLVEGPPVVRSFTAGLPQPFRSLVLFASLAAPLIALCWWGKVLLGYSLARTTKHKEDA